MRNYWVAAAVLILVSGCAATQPGSLPEPPVEAPATEQPAPIATGIEIGGTGFSILFDDDSAEDYAYASDPAEALGALTVALGDPVVTDVALQHCEPEHHLAAWGGLTLGTDYKWLPEGQQFFLRADTSSAIAVPVTTTNGLELGGSIADVFAASPDYLRFAYEDQSGTTSYEVYFDVQDYVPPSDVTLPGANGTTPWGAVALSQGDDVTRISASDEFSNHANC